MKKKIIIIAAIVLAAAAILTAVILITRKNEPPAPEQTTAAAPEEPEEPDVSMKAETPEEPEQPAAPETPKEPETPAAPAGPGAWTVCWYLCGSNLESFYGCASSDLEEAMAASLPENVRVIIETGGANEWHNDIVSAGVIRRFLLDQNGLTQLEELPNADMGEADTLADFLRFCGENYPAERNMLLFWNHGGGSVGGAAFDETYGYDALTLNEFAAALEQVYPAQQEKPFKLVGFDTCLMATVDVASTFRDYADYMVASEELEPGCGWYYTGWLQALADDPAMDGAALGRVICDSYAAECGAQDCGGEITLSLVDLSKIETLTQSYDKLGQEALLCALEDPAFFACFDREARATENYGGNTREQGYANMVDLGQLVRNCAELVPETTEAVLNALEDCVLYQVSGPYRAEASGLSCYYSYNADLNDFADYTMVGSSEAFKYLYAFRLTGELSSSGLDYVSRMGYPVQKDSTLRVILPILPQNVTQQNLSRLIASGAVDRDAVLLPDNRTLTGSAPTLRLLANDADPSPSNFPDGEDPNGGKTDGEDPTGGDPSGGKTDGEDPNGGKTDGKDPTGEDPTGRDPTGEDPTGEDPAGDDPAGDDPNGDKPNGNPNDDLNRLLEEYLRQQEEKEKDEKPDEKPSDPQEPTEKPTEPQKPTEKPAEKPNEKPADPQKPAQNQQPTARPQEQTGEEAPEGPALTASGLPIIPTLNDFDLSKTMRAYVDENGDPTLELDPALRDALGAIRIRVRRFVTSETAPDQVGLIEWGETDLASIDWKKGSARTWFSGYWASLDDTPLLTEICYSSDAYTIINTPVLLNGVACNLHIVGVKQPDGSLQWHLLGAHRSADPETGMADRVLFRLQPGDEIVPLYYIQENINDPNGVWKPLQDTEPIIYESEAQLNMERDFGTAIYEVRFELVDYRNQIALSERFIVHTYEGSVVSQLWSDYENRLDTAVTRVV